MREAVVELRGEIAADLADYAKLKIAGVLRHTGRAVLRVHVWIERYGDPARERPITAAATVDLDGVPVQVHVAATKPREAVDMLVERLDHRLERMSHDRGQGHDRANLRDAHERAADAGEPVEREIVRHPTISPQECTVDDAVVEMDDLDLDFHLFVEAGSGQDAVVYRDGPTGLQLARVGGGFTAAGPHAVDLTVSPHPAPVLDTQEAVDRLRMTGLPFLFYRDRDGGRANVIYHRHDGNYGLLDPAVATG